MGKKEGSEAKGKMTERVRKKREDKGNREEKVRKTERK